MSFSRSPAKVSDFNSVSTRRMTPVGVYLSLLDVLLNISPLPEKKVMLIAVFYKRGDLL